MKPLYKNWRTPFLEACKKRGIKFTNKNNKKLRNAYAHSILSTYGYTLQNALHVEYADALSEMEISESLISRINKDMVWNGFAIIGIT